MMKKKESFSKEEVKKRCRFNSQKHKIDLICTMILACLALNVQAIYADDTVDNAENTSILLTNENTTTAQELDNEQEVTTQNSVLTNNLATQVKQLNTTNLNTTIPTGSVTIHFYGVDASGNVVKELTTPRIVSQNEDQNDSFITTESGEIWQAVGIRNTNLHANTDGSSESGVINHYYEQIGEVKVRYVLKGTDTDIADMKYVALATPVGTDYNDIASYQINKDGQNYKFVGLRSDSAPSKGKITSSVPQTIIYEYVPTTFATIRVHYNIIDESGNVVIADIVDPTMFDIEEGESTSYEDTAFCYKQLLGFNGKNYEFVNATGDSASGKIDITCRNVYYNYREIVATSKEENSTPASTTQKQLSGKATDKSKNKKELPKTGESSQSYLSIVGVIPILAAFGLARRKNPNKY